MLQRGLGLRQQDTGLLGVVDRLLGALAGQFVEAVDLGGEVEAERTHWAPPRFSCSTYFAARGCE
jgi:hypothetical protein